MKAEKEERQKTMKAKCLHHLCHDSEVVRVPIYPTLRTPSFLACDKLHVSPSSLAWDKLHVTPGVLSTPSDLARWLRLSVYSSVRPLAFFLRPWFSISIVNQHSILDSTVGLMPTATSCPTATAWTSTFTNTLKL